jgi:hypothetical protein
MVSTLVHSQPSVLPVHWLHGLALAVVMIALLFKLWHSAKRAHRQGHRHDGVARGRGAFRSLRR